MQNKEIGEQEKQQNSAEWLNLSLGRNPSGKNNKITDPKSETLPVSTKIFTCNFCMRRFYSSQALGGHQNAHRRERGAVRHYHQSRKMMPMVTPPINNTSMVRSLGVKAHALVHKPGGRNRASTAARFGETNTRVEIAYLDDEAEDCFMWPGSFHFYPQKAEVWKSLSTKTLDLNLKL